uniref:Secreted protein n=1 Tax=Streptomyces sp. NBC_00049 TaxID=2903617 RepID=A0AAU2K3I0_9ACTN
MAAVIATAGLVQPATGTTATTAAPAANGPQATAPDPAAVTYPLDCKGAPQAVTASAQGDLDGDGRPETVAAVRCDAGSGTPPHALYVLTRDRTEGAPPRVVATLLDTAQRQTATDLTVRDGAVTATLLGYSSPDVPRYSPDVKKLAKWRWSGGKFRQELTDSTARSV